MPVGCPEHRVLPGRRPVVDPKVKELKQVLVTASSDVDVGSNILQPRDATHAEAHDVNITGCGHLRDTCAEPRAFASH